MELVIQYSPEALVKEAKRAVVGLLVFVGVAGFANCHTGCKPAGSAAEVEAAYTAEIIGCSAKAKTLAESRTCRTEVNKRYGLCDVDGGHISPCDQ